MSDTTDRYTPEELVDYAKDMESDGLSSGAAMLRQAASDAARIAELEADKERLDWLAMQFVDVREPLVYGSRLAFSGTPKIDHEGIDEEPFNIRAAIDAARSHT